MPDGTYGYDQAQVNEARTNLDDLGKKFNAAVAFMTEISNGTTNKWTADAQPIFREKLATIEEDSQSLEMCTTAIREWLDSVESAYGKADQAAIERAEGL